MEKSEIIGIIEKFKRWLNGERKSRYTVTEYSMLARDFLRFTGKAPSEIGYDDIEGYKAYLALEKRYSKGSQYLCIKAVRSLFKCFGIDPPKNLTSPTRSKKVPVYLTEEETRRLLNYSYSNIRDLAIVSILVYTGIRVSELCSLNIADVDLESGTLKVISGKGDKDRITLMSNACISTLKEYMAIRQRARSDSRALFLTYRMNRIDPSAVQRMISSASREAGISKKVTPHVLRHTFATTILRNGGDIRFIQKLLGHSSIATTEIYTHIDENTLRKMYEKFKPTY